MLFSNDGWQNQQIEWYGLTSNVTRSYLPLCKGWNLTVSKCEDVQMFSNK